MTIAKDRVSIFTFPRFLGFGRIVALHWPTRKSIRTSWQKTRTNIEGWRALKMLAVENDTTLNALAVEAFNDLLKKHGKRQSVENPLLE